MSEIRNDLPTLNPRFLLFQLIRVTLLSQEQEKATFANFTKMLHAHPIKE